PDPVVTRSLDHRRAAALAVGAFRRRRTSARAKLEEVTGEVLFARHPCDRPAELTEAGPRPLRHRREPRLFDLPGALDLINAQLAVAAQLDPAHALGGRVAERRLDRAVFGLVVRQRPELLVDD